VGRRGSSDSARSSYSPDVSHPVSEPTNDSAIARILSGQRGTPRTVDDHTRRLQGWELLLVLAIFPLGSAYQAIIDLIQRIQTHVPVTSHDIPPINGPWLAATLSVVPLIAELSVAALVVYLLIRSGEGTGSLNLGWSGLRIDLALVLPIFIVVFWFPEGLGAHVVSWLHLHGFYLYPAPPSMTRSALTFAQLAQSVTAGVLEEVVVLAYLVRRLEQRGFGAAAVVAIDVAVRISYHLYYGWNVIPIALWALVSVLAYRRVRRLLPFILCHIAWDAAIPLRAFYGGAYYAIWLAVVAITGVMTIIWLRWTPEGVSSPASISTTAS
jgi:Type II CAAX prenyl endopeptidase Rce1-like